MDGTKSETWAVRTGDSTQLVASLEALLAQLDAGALDAGALVRAPGSTRWQRLGDLVSTAPADPWAAWDDMDGRTPARPPSAARPAEPHPRAGDDLRGPSARPPPPAAPRPFADVEVDVTVELSDDPVTEPPARAATPRAAPIIQPPDRGPRAPASGRAVDPAANAPHGVSPLPPGPSPVAHSASERPPAAPVDFGVQPPPRGQPDNIIAFPAGRRPQLSGQLALEEDPLPAVPMGIVAAQPPPPRVAVASPPLRWQAIAIYASVALVCLMGLALARWYVRESAQATYSLGSGAPDAAARPAAADPPAAPAPVAAPTPAAAPAPAADAPIGAVYASLEDELRGLMLADLLNIDAEGELEDALFIELRRVRLDLVSVDAEVTAWGGRKLDVPQAARFDVRLRANPDNVDRELAAVALVVGKYIHQYSLEVAAFDVVIEGVADMPLRRPIDPAAARELYLQRRSLAAFIDGMRQ